MRPSDAAIYLPDMKIGRSMSTESDIAAFNFKCGMWMRANEFNPFRLCESSDWCCMRYIWRILDLAGYKNDRKYTAHTYTCAMLSLLPLLYSMLIHINATFLFVSLLYISMNYFFTYLFITLNYYRACSLSRAYLPSETSQIQYRIEIDTIHPL